MYLILALSAALLFTHRLGKSGFITFPFKATHFSWSVCGKQHKAKMIILNITALDDHTEPTVGINLLINVPSKYISKGAITVKFSPDDNNHTHSSSSTW